MIRWDAKRPAEVRDYEHDWAPFLGNDVITSETHSATGVTIDSVEISDDDQASTFWVSGDTVGTALITSTITTAGGRTESETFLLPISEAEEPISLADAKAHLRVTDDSEDAYISCLIPAARRYVENRSGVIIKQREFTERQLPQYGAIKLYQGPIIGDVAVAYQDADGADASYIGARHFTGWPIVFPALGDSWPSPYAGEAFTITYTAGLSAEELATDEYAGLIHAMKLLIGHWHERRSGVGETPVQEVPLAVNDLCDQVRAVLV